MQELLALYRFALRSGDGRLAEALARAMRSDAELHAQADLALQALPRGAAGRARAGRAAERAVVAALRRMASGRT
jgi:hypothetical protein